MCEGMTMKPNEFVDKYLKEAQPIFEVYRSESFTKAMDLMWTCYQEGRQIFIFGNGGSAGTSSHMVNDLSKGTAV
jgi:D-sedoheptulose 7-phosphate isomerase